MLVTISGFEPLARHLSDVAFPVNVKLSVYKKSEQNHSSSDRALIFTSIRGCLL